MKYLPLFHHFKAIYQFPKHIIFLFKIVANAPLRMYVIQMLNIYIQLLIIYFDQNYAPPDIFLFKLLLWIYLLSLDNFCEYFIKITSRNAE